VSVANNTDIVLALIASVTSLAVAAVGAYFASGARRFSRSSASNIALAVEALTPNGDNIPPVVELLVTGNSQNADAIHQVGRRVDVLHASFDRFAESNDEDHRQIRDELAKARASVTEHEGGKG
jgi:hypothetical protein